LTSSVVFSVLQNQLQAISLELRAQRLCEQNDDGDSSIDDELTSDL